ncbi:MAG: peptidylprolyl isomerase [Candidatus Peribacteraceae bacterium]|nr:peptidylprolyl isomerase [Candidatus Peribacteraceae bacterium]
MKKLLLTLCSLALLAGCKGSDSAFTGMHTVLIKTSLGDITVDIDADAAPKTAENFLTHVQDGYYNELTFHRVIPDFMIQGGDPLGNGTGGESIWGGSFEDEINAKSYNLHKQLLRDMTDENLPAELAKMTVKEYYEKEGYQYDNSLKSLPMERGAIAMANAGPNTNGSQFFIIQRGEGTPWLEGKHTVFGKVTAGMDVVDAIAAVERNAGDQPLEPVTYTMQFVQ